MVLNAEEVRVAITGELYKAPLGTAAPADSTSVLDPDYVGLGYVSEDGVTENWDDSVDNIVAWQNATTVRSATTESTGTVELTLIQTRGNVLEAFHRGSTMTEPTPGNFELEVKPIVADPSSWILDVIDGAKHIRIYLGNAEITERGEIMYANGEPVGYPITITVYPDADGNLMVKFSDDIAWGEDIAGS
jgi:PKD repeat protein